MARKIIHTESAEGYKNMINILTSVSIDNGITWHCWNVTKYANLTEWAELMTVSFGTEGLTLHQFKLEISTEECSDDRIME